MSCRQAVISPCRSAMRLTIGIRSAPSHSRGRPAPSSNIGRSSQLGQAKLRRRAGLLTPHEATRTHPRTEPVAQPVEHVSFNHGVAGSSPAGLATVVSGTLILDGAVTAIRCDHIPYSNPLCRLLQATLRPTSRDDDVVRTASRSSVDMHYKSTGVEPSSVRGAKIPRDGRTG